MASFIFEQFRFLNIFIINGFLIGLMYDFFRSIRKVYKVNDITTYIQDLIFSVLVGDSLIISIYFLNEGEIRGYSFLFIIIGMIVYYLILSKIFMKIYFFILDKIKIIVNCCYKLIDKFLKILYNLLQCLVHKNKLGIKIVNSIKKTIKKKDFLFFCRKK